MWYRLAVDVRPGGEVIGVSWERRDNDGFPERVSCVTSTRPPSLTLASAIALAWRDVVEREGLVPFP